MNATTPHVHAGIAQLLLALNALGTAIAAARPDGADVVRLFKAGRLRVLIDECEGVIVFGRADDENRLVWIETVAFDPSQPETFGTLVSLVLGACPTVTH